MLINKIEKKNRGLIRKFLTKHGMKSIVNHINFELNDEAPDQSYYSYYCEIEGRKFGIQIDYDDNYILLHFDYVPKLANHIDEL